MEKFTTESTPNNIESQDEIELKNALESIPETDDQFKIDNYFFFANTESPARFLYPAFLANPKFFGSVSK